MMIQTIFLVILMVTFALLCVLCWMMLQYYKELTRLQADLERLKQQKCAFIQAQERAALINELKKHTSKADIRSIKL